MYCPEKFASSSSGRSSLETGSGVHQVGRTASSKSKMIKYLAIVPNYCEEGCSSHGRQKIPHRRKCKPGKNLIGKSSADKLRLQSWLWNQKIDFLKCVQKILTLNADKFQVLGLVKSTVFSDLPVTMPIALGEVDSAVCTYVNNPSEFFLVLERRADYSLQNTSWKNIFPPFKTGPEAHRGIQALLNLFYRLAPIVGYNHKLHRFYPAVGDLVVVKVVRKYNNPKKHEVLDQQENTEDEFIFQLRRGVVENIFINADVGSPLYCVYLLDFGYQICISKEFLYPLFHPFNSIAPLAIKCGLFGISPIGENWDEIGEMFFQQILEKYRGATLSAQFLSSHYASPQDSTLESLSSRLPYIVNLEAHKLNMHTARVEFELNFAEVLVAGIFGIQWNFTPSRPKLVAGTYVPRTDVPGRSSGTRVTISLRDSTILTAFHPLVCCLFPVKVLKREVDKLFRLRGHDLHDVKGMHNRLMIVMDDQAQFLRKPCVGRLLWDRNKNESEVEQRRSENNSNKVEPQNDVKVEPETDVKVEPENEVKVESENEVKLEPENEAKGEHGIREPCG